MVAGETDPETGPRSTSTADLSEVASSRADLDNLVAELLGRRPQGRYQVAVKRPNGIPVVLVNEPLLESGRPMPTRYWLIDPALNKAIGTLESIGGVKTAEATVDPVELQAAHDRYRRERELQIDPEHTGPKPSGGVGGTRIGVKCLHAHYGYYLAGGDDPVGRWVDGQLHHSGDAVADLLVVHHAATDHELGSEGSSVGSVAGAEPHDGVALVELGSGALKLVVASGQGLIRRRFTTNMFAEMDDQGQLSEPGRANLIAALDQVREASAGVGHFQVVATEALRQLPNSDVHALVRDRLGVEVELLDGRREAELGYYAASSACSAPDSAARPVALDIGYGSTELATVGADDQLHAISLPIGAYSITSQYLPSDPPRADELSAALSVIELHIDDIKREEPQLATAVADGVAEIVGLGFVRFIAEVELGCDEGDEIDGYWLEHRHVEEVFRILATESAADRVFNPGLQPERVPWIVGALCILVELMRQFDIEGLRISTFGVLDGLLAERNRSRQAAAFTTPEPSTEAEAL